MELLYLLQAESFVYLGIQILGYSPTTIAQITKLHDSVRLYIHLHHLWGHNIVFFNNFGIFVVQVFIQMCC